MTPIKLSALALASALLASTASAEATISTERAFLYERCFDNANCPLIKESPGLAECLAKAAESDAALAESKTTESEAVDSQAALTAASAEDATTSDESATASTDDTASAEDATTSDESAIASTDSQSIEEASVDKVSTPAASACFLQARDFWLEHVDKAIQEAVELCTTEECSTKLERSMQASMIFLKGMYELPDEIYADGRGYDAETVKNMRSAEIGRIMYLLYSYPKTFVE